MSGVVISKSPAVLVAPPSEMVTAAGDITLSWCDKMFGHSPMTVLFVFDHAIQHPVETIRRGLSQALVHYYPMAGRFATGATDEQVFIKCTSLAGVPLVAASANCAIKDAEAALSDPALQQQLAVFLAANDGRGYCEADPLVLMQVTVFSCGGFVLGVTWSHAVADGIGIAQFVQAVAELARGLAFPSVVPARHDGSLMLGMSPHSTSPSEFMSNIQLYQLAALDITIKASLIQHIKDKYASVNSGRTCTVFEAVTAVLWRCRTRAIGAAPEALAMLTFLADVRKRVGAKEGYYGNCVMARGATASSGTVANCDLMDLVNIVQRAKGGAAAPDAPNDFAWYNFLNMASWRNIGLEAPDFGGGRPAMVKCYSKPGMQLPSCVACIPCKYDYNVMSVFVTDDHAGAFLHELQDMHLNYF